METTTLKDRFIKAGCNESSFVATIGAVTKNANWYTFVAQVVTAANKIEQFVCKLNAGAKNDEYIAECEAFFKEFKAGDYLMSNVAVRIAGATWTDEAGKEGIYKESYISVPFTSNMIALGNDAVLNAKKKEAEYARLALSAIKLEVE